MIRPRPARWFEALVARDDATLALEALAATGAIELEARPSAALPAALVELRPLIAEFAELARAYRAYWPNEGIRPSSFPEAPAVVLKRDIARIRSWAVQAEPVIRELQAIESERGELRLWQQALAELGQRAPGLEALAGDGQRSARLIPLPKRSLPAPPAHTLMRAIDVAGTGYVLAIGPPAELDTLSQFAAASQRTSLAVPHGLEDATQAGAARIAARLPALELRCTELRATLESLADTHALGTAIADARRLGWMVDNVRALESGDHFCVITGWTSEARGARLAAALEQCGARAILHFPRAPAGMLAPLLFANPGWVRPFEVFAKALGMPSRDEVDPSVLLVVTVPLLFGYMFGDVGQGLVIAIVGYLLRDRHPVARLFIAGGLSAMAFGLLFGSVFSLHAIEPVWIDVLARPLDVLVVPIVGGALLLGCGLLLAGLEAHWRGEFIAWLASDAALVVVYFGLLGAFVSKPALAVAAGGAVLFCTGHALHTGRISAAGSALAELVERTLQLLINTLSFARVGAFALAHAGLSSAIVALMDATSDVFTRTAVLVVGNVVVIVLETLVVSIQTTRLVLFEFFTRFLRATGRTFRPLPLPPSTT